MGPLAQALLQIGLIAVREYAEARVKAMKEKPAPLIWIEKPTCTTPGYWICCKCSTWNVPHAQKHPHHCRRCKHGHCTFCRRES